MTLQMNEFRFFHEVCKLRAAVHDVKMGSCTAGQEGSSLEKSPRKAACVCIVPVALTSSGGGELRGSKAKGEQCTAGCRQG
jgi:hypothetical protein